jgi:hypothetical protein
VKGGKTVNTKQLLILTLGSGLLLSPPLLKAHPGQDQNQESVAEAARAAQAAKKTAPPPKMVIDNDNLDTLKGTVSVVGQEPPPAEDQTKEAGDKTKTALPPEAKKPAAKDEAYWRQAFGDANKKLADDAHELDILQREYNLKEQQYYSDPNTAMKQDYTRQDLTDTKTKIDDKTAAVAADKQAIADLEDALRKAGGDPGWETPAQPAPPAGQ